MEKKSSIFYGWWILIAATIVICAQGVMFYGFGILFNAILGEFHWSRAITSSIFSFQISINSLFILLMGYLIDKYSPRLLIGIGTIFLAAGHILSGLTQEIWHLYLFFGIIVGIGTSTTYMPPLTVVTRWFEKKRGLALGIAVTGIGIGAFLGAPFINWLIQSFGWRTALPILGIVTGSVVFIAAMVLTGYPEEKGLKPYGVETSQGALERQSSPDPQEQTIPWERSNDLDWTVWNAIKTRVFLILFFMLLLAEIALLGVMNHLFTYATENGLPKHVVSWSYSVIGIASLVGKIGIGGLSDRIGRKAAFLFSLFLNGTAFIFLLPAPNIIFLYIFAAILGISYGGWTPLFPAIVGDYFGLGSMGKIFSVLTINYCLGGICGPILAGWIFDRMGSYFWAFLIFSIVCYLATILTLFLKAPEKALK